MTERERLIELIIASVDGCAECLASRIADYLLDNGVIVPDVLDEGFCWLGERRAE